MATHVYAEHLINIRTLTIQVSLPSPSGQDTAISAHGNVLSLSHRGETSSVTLPISSPAQDARLSIPPVPSKDLNFRVRLADTGSLQDSPSSETVIPWTAATLSPQVELQCNNCHAVVLQRAKIQTWKDLPSEGWAEMMEFWHCHKPNEPHNHEQQTDKKGYSAESTLAISPSVGLVNATSFILAAEDCNNIKVGRLYFHYLDFLPHWALKRTGAFRPQGYCIWKIRDIAALKQTLAARSQLQPLRKLWVLWRSTAHRLCDLIVVSWSSWARRRSQLRYILLYPYNIYSVHSEAISIPNFELINLFLRCFQLFTIQIQMPTPT